ncbi:MAG: hypothetical protein IJX23_00320 [Clostridia bacterium]|nr:hypothetical protein [Clostridia bacterium]
MKISINSNNGSDTVIKGKDMVIRIPNFLVLNNTALNFAKKQKGGQYIPDIPKDLMPKLRKVIRQVKKIHKNWVLVDVASADGSSVQIKL